MTLLDLTQDILNDMDSDAVNAITDTEESLQVAQIIKTTYYEMMSRRDWSHLNTIGQFESVSDSDLPNYLKASEDVGAVSFVLYNRRKKDETRNRFEDVKYEYPDEFMRRLMNRNSDDDRVTQVKDPSGVILNIYNDKQPRYYTSFDDEYIVFDSWLREVESTMLGTQSQVHFTKIPKWVHDNNFVPALPDKHFPALLAEAKSAATLKLKEEADDKAEQQSKRQQNKLSLDGWKINRDMRYPDYGRKSSKAPQRRRMPIFGSRT